MYQIPGLDNGPGDLKDNAYGVKTYEYNNPQKELNAGRYHRWFKEGNAPRIRSFDDDSLYIAFNSQERIYKMPLTTCTGKGATRKCSRMHHSVSYAVPFEVVYTTPLSRWNPHGIVFTNRSREVTANGRDGGFDNTTAFDGSSETNYYMTPCEFYTGEKVGERIPDESKGDR